MAESAERGPGDVHYLPGPAAIIASSATAGACWLLAVGGFVKVVAILSERGWVHTLSLVVLGGSVVLAAWATRRLIQAIHIRFSVPTSLLDRRYHGNLDEIVDSERRALRSIGATAADVAARTGELLGELIDIPSVRIFRGVRPQRPETGPTTHAIVAGRTLILVESVAWPPGQYSADADGRLRCDGVYIGQSVAPLAAAVRQWRTALPRGHQVSALIVVYPTAGGRPTLPASSAPAPSWTHPDDFLPAIRQRVPRRPTVSRHAIAALAAAVAPIPHQDPGGGCAGSGD